MTFTLELLSHSVLFGKYIWLYLYDNFIHSFFGNDHYSLTGPLKQNFKADDDCLFEAFGDIVQD